MEIKSELILRVNGINVTEVKLRHPAVEGHLKTDVYEVEIADSVLGKFALTEDCIIEVCGGNFPAWSIISLKELLILLLS